MDQITAIKSKYFVQASQCTVNLIEIMKHKIDYREEIHTYISRFCSVSTDQNKNIKSSDVVSLSILLAKLFEISLNRKKACEKSEGKKIKRKRMIKTKHFQYIYGPAF